MPKQKSKSITGLFEKAQEVAEHYGFSSLAKILREAEETRGAKKAVIHPPKPDTPGEADRLSIMRAYIDLNLSNLPQPLMIYHSEPLHKTMDRSTCGGKNAVQFSLEMIGSSKSIAEATLFKTAFAILREVGFENFTVTINSLGDRDSINRFIREFTNYYRKRITEVPNHCRQWLKKDVFKVLECSQEKCMLIKEHAPKPIAALSEESRAHFSEVLEFLESMQVPYMINNCLVGGKDYYTRTIFEIQTEDTVNKKYPKATFSPTLARGGRYDDLSRKAGSKKDVAAVGISISMGGLGLLLPKRRKENKSSRKSGVYLIHLGMLAKQQSLQALELLRKSKISVYQSLSRDRISVQVAAAEKMNIPYTIIIGQKEALEGTAIVRNMSTRSQETIPLPALPTRLKKIR